MAPIDQVAIQRIGTEALAEAVVLTVEANWNQTADDWTFFIGHGTVFGARDATGRLVATAALLPYPAGFAWVSLVIVAKSHRGHGLANRMLHECIAALRERALVAVLDATPAGARVYAPLGFRPIMELKRWEGTGSVVASRDDRERAVPISDVDRIVGFDAVAFGARRGALLADFCARGGARGFELLDRDGYALVRSGRVASQLGPVVAASERDALILLEASIASTQGAIFVDVPEAWTEIEAGLSAHGFAVQRPFVRMALGRDTPYGDPARVFAIAGPEYG
jgi:GNAT superfamily N-acetyltransferase